MPDRVFFFFVAMLSTAISSKAFSVAPLERNRRLGLRSQENDHVDEPKSTAPAGHSGKFSEEMVSRLMSFVPSSLANVSDEQRDLINDAIVGLEASNPSREPACSPLMNGIWELRYAGGYATEGSFQSPTRQLALFMYSGGYSPAIFALSLAQGLPAAVGETRSVELSISPEQPRVQAKASFQSQIGDAPVVVKARLEVESAVRLRETYEVVTVAGRVFELPQFLQYSRKLYVTYIDDDMLIVRDGSGVPELLTRKANW